MIRFVALGDFAACNFSFAPSPVSSIRSNDLPRTRPLQQPSGAIGTSPLSISPPTSMRSIMCQPLTDCPYPSVAFGKKGLLMPSQECGGFDWSSSRRFRELVQGQREADWRACRSGEACPASPVRHLSDLLRSRFARIRRALQIRATAGQCAPSGCGRDTSRPSKNDGA